MFELNDKPKVILLFSAMCVFIAVCVYMCGCMHFCVWDVNREYPEAKSSPLEFSIVAGRLATAQNYIQ